MYPYQCEFFLIQELVPPQVYMDRGPKAWELLDDRALWTLDALRIRYGPIVVNNYYWGREREWSGLRTPGSPYYSPYSQHTFGRAFDCLFALTTAKRVRRDILEHPHDEEFRFITAIELNVSWLHFDVRNCERVMTFTP